MNGLMEVLTSVAGYVIVKSFSDTENFQRMFSTKLLPNVGKVDL